jgi:hypothetical protein
MGGDEPAVLLSPPPLPGMVAPVAAGAFADEEAQRVSFVRLSLVDMICSRTESASALVHSIGDVNRKEGKSRHDHVCRRTRHHCRQNLGLPPTIAWDLEIATLL